MIMHDIVNADWFVLVLVLIAIVFLLLLCYLLSQLHSMKNENRQGLIERTKRKRSEYYNNHPDWGNRTQLNNGNIEKGKNDGNNAAKKMHKADSELARNTIEDYDVGADQQDNVIVWNNLESIPTDSNLAEISEFDKHVVVESKYKYMQAAVEGRFIKLLSSEEKCFFRTWEEHGERKYEFYGNVNKALANINAIFDDVCEIEGKQNGATNIENIAPGIIDENLKILKKATIKLT